MEPPGGVVGLDEVGGYGRALCYGSPLGGDEHRCFPQHLDIFDLRRRAERLGVAEVIDQVVLDAELFDEPEDALRLGVLQSR